MSTHDNTLRQRLSRLTLAQRAQLARRLDRESIAAHAAGAARTSIAKAAPLRVDVDARGRQAAVYPASNGQQRMWFMHQRAPDSPVYCTPTAFRLHGPLHIATLAAAFQRVIQRHDNLRTTFVLEQQQLLQRVASYSTFQLEQLPAAHTRAEDRKAAAEQCIRHAACAPFDLAAAPPFRVLLASIEPDQHLLLIVMHHIISDGWSVSNLCRELSAIYAALSGGTALALPELPLQLADYSAWQLRLLASGALEQQASYWNNKLAGEPEPLDLAANGPRPAAESFRGGECSLPIDEALLDALKARAQHSECTLFMLLLAAFKVLLHRYSGQSDLLVGVPVANRQRPELAGLIGLLANTLVMRTAIAREATFEQLLNRVKETALEAYEHQDMPFELLVQQLQVRRDASRTPLFQATFALQDYPPTSLQLAGIEVSPYPVSTHTSKFDLSLAVRPAVRGLTATLEFSSELFAPERAREMLQHWHALLLAIAANPAQRVTEIAPHVRPNRHAVPPEWNRIERDYAPDKCIHELFEQQVVRTPDAIAVVFEADSLSYRELNTRANRLSHHLRALGVRPDVLVGLCVERSLEMLIGVLAILKSGGGYVPLDPVNPPQRLAQLLEDAQPAVVLTQTTLAARLPALQPGIICLDDPRQATWNDQPATNPQYEVHPAALAYVMFTSGSSGRPKGVLITHHNVVRFMQAAASWFQFNERDVWTMFHSYAFDMSVWEIWGALLHGGRLVVVPYAVTRSPSAFYQLLSAEKVTVLNQTPSAFLPLIQAEAAAEVPLELALRYITFGGEALHMQSLKPWFERHGDRCPQLVNTYGPTETTVWVTYRPLTSQDVHGPSLIGRPTPDSQVYILDADRQPVAIGISGELFIGGAGLARGYLNRPDLTSECFIAHPFSSASQQRLYRTGDLVRWRDDGDIEFLGRRDQQVKIRGHRIELAEIQAALSAHPEVASCAVLVKKASAEEQLLLAFVVGREHAEPAVISLRQWLAHKLPDYMIPARFVRVPVLPLNINGKLDSKALMMLDATELALGTDYAAARNLSERALVQIWQAALRRDQVGIRDNFFDLGGHSLLAVVVCLRATSVLGVQVPLGWLFEHPTIEGLAQHIESSKGELQVIDAIEKAPLHKPPPMSFAQRQMWLLRQSSPDPATYNQPIAWHLHGQVDREQVRRALQAILERHEVLRTALVQRGEELLQQITPANSAALPWSEIDLRAVAPDDKQHTLERLLLQEARRPFDLGQAPLWRAVWIELEQHQCVLAFSFHHSIVDEWSLRLFFQELAAIYASGGRVEHASLPELPAQYADYCAWQTRQLTALLREQLRSYWTQQLRALPPDLELPADLSRPLQASGRGAVLEFLLPDAVVTGLRALARQERTTLFTVALAAFQVWLHRYTGQSDLVVGTPTANRERPEARDLLGNFLNTVPIRARLDAGAGFIDVLGQVRATVLGALAHARLPFEQIVDLADKQRGAGQPCLFRVMFVLLEEGLAPLRLDQLRVRRLPMHTNTSKNDLILNIRPVDQSLACELQYDTDLFSADRVAGMARHLTELFRSITEHPQLPISQLNLLPEAERDQILMQWNRTERDYPRDKCIHQLFEQQAARAPDATAVVFEADCLSYRELNTRASRVSCHLRALGVGPNVLVALSIERSFEMIIAVLGILKAGGAYWALEDGLPPERLQRLLADARPRLLLVRRKSAMHAPDLTAMPPADAPAMACIEDLLESSVEETSADASADQASQPAYVSYTSGSTGLPKGVVVPHRAAVRLVMGSDYATLNAHETLLHLSPLAFDASTFELWGALLNGGRVVLLPPGAPTLAQIGEAIRRHRVTTVWLTAGLFHLMVDERLEDLKPLRQLLAGGDVLSPEHVRKAHRALPGCRIINGYGPTENTTFTCCYTVADERELTPTVPIGRPIANTQIYILDEARQPVPVGVAGELYAGGDGLACGYLRQPGMTAERFVPHPFDARAGARLYRSGDRARWRNDGNVEFLGRLDAQVKIRGFRVELGEIEAALRAQAEVREAIAMVRVAAHGDKQLVAYLVAEGAAKPDAPSLRARLAEKLPEYMLPNSFLWLERLPLTAGGKLDRKALPVPQTGDVGTAGENSAPINLLELKLHRIWQQLFARHDIGRQDNFFDLGGNSLLATRLAAQIDKLLGCQLPIATLFHSATIESLAQRLEQEDWTPPWSSLVPLQPLGSKPPIFFVHGAKGEVFGFLDLTRLLAPHQPCYGIQAVGLDGRTARHTTFEDMAAHYVREIVSFQPDGPIQLAGYSLGGVLAFEIAQQLHRVGRPVAVLALLDSWPVGPIPWLFHALAMMILIPSRLLSAVRRSRDLPLRDRFNFLRRRWPVVRRLLERNRPRPALVPLPASTDRKAPQMPGSIDYYHAVALRYRLRSYPGALDLFVSDDAHGYGWYWRYLARGGVAFHRVPGRHDEILLPQNLPVLANSLTGALGRTQADEPRATSPDGSVNGQTQAELTL